MLSNVATGDGAPHMRVGTLLACLVVLGVGHEIWSELGADTLSLHVKALDGWEVPCWPSETDEACATELRAHDEIARSTYNAVVGPRGAPWTAKGPEGLIFVFPPGETRSEAAKTLEKEYPAQIATRIAAGEFDKEELDPITRLKIGLISQGYSADEANAVFDTPEAAGRKAFAEGLAKNEKKRQQRVAATPPLSTESVEARIANAREAWRAKCQSAWLICYPFAHWKGLL
jgi:hypothetical protein